MPLLPGTKLGPYEILAPIGAGGMGEVYKAKDTRLDRLVAVKVLPEHLATHPDALARFECEAKAVAALNHPNILGLFDIGREKKTAYAVMELLEGESLRARLDQGPIAPRKATELAVQMAQGLAAAHVKGIVHRDLKPENLWITKDGRLKILDFGLARQLERTGGIAGMSTEAAAPGHLTDKGTILGTMGYMSPEQVRGESVDSRSDIFSFGVVLFEMLTGRRAFSRDTASETMAAILRDDPPEHEGGATRPIPPVLRRILDHCLEKQPVRRFHDMQDLAFALESFSGDSSAPAAPLAPAVRLEKMFPPPALAAMALVAVLTWGLTTWFQPRPSPSASPVAVRTLTYSGHDRSPASSPDGRTIAFSSDRDGRHRIWLKQIKGGGEVAITDGNDDFPRFSPDGSTVLFIRTEGNAKSVYRVSLLGTDPRKVVGDATSADWFPKGDQVVFLRHKSEGPDALTLIMLVAAGGGSERELARIKGPFLSQPRWSPDGKWIAMTNSVGQLGARVGKAYVIDAVSGVVREYGVANKHGAVSSLTWLSTEEFLYFQSESVMGNGTGGSAARVYRQVARTGAAKALFWSPSSARGVDVLPDGRVVFDGMSGRQNLREYSLSRAFPPRWITRGNIYDRQPVFSRDGEWVVFASNRSGNINIWAVSPQTGDIRTITDDLNQDWDPGFTTDGQHLLWSSSRSGAFEIWMANSDGTDAHQVTHDGEDAENPTQTLDGKWILYCSGNSKQPGLWKIHPDGTGAKRILSGNYLLLPEVSPDGKWVSIIDRSNPLDGMIRVFRVEDGTPTAFSIHHVELNITSFLVSLGRTRWMPDGRQLVFTGRDALGRYGVFVQDFDPEKDTSATRRPLAGFDPDWITESLGISPDGARLVLSESERVFSVMIAEGDTPLVPERETGK